MMPVRIQRQRIKGWKMPENTVYVGRPGRWGNPFAVIGKGQNSKYPPMTAQLAVDAYRRQMPEFTKEAARRELAGKNLACFCKLGEPCHADVLLEIANAEIWP
jgi:hypothetical protein